MAFAAKIGSLFVKTLSKPIASRVKDYAKSHPVARSSMIVFAQKKHEFTTWASQTLKSEDSPKVFAGRLSEERALAAGADFLGESLIFAVAGAVTYYEYRKGNIKDEQKSAKVVANNE
eukprot:gene14871-17582_t